LAQPIAALLAWAALEKAGAATPLFYGVAFGMTAGLLLFVALVELLPASEDRVSFAFAPLCSGPHVLFYCKIALVEVSCDLSLFICSLCCRQATAKHEWVWSDLGWLTRKNTSGRVQPGAKEGTGGRVSFLGHGGHGCH
jgi:hypothetical protein